MDTLTNREEKPTIGATAVPAPLANNIVVASPRHFDLRALKFIWAHRWFALMCLVVIAVAGFFATRAILGPAVVVDRAKRAALVETVVASGHVESPYRTEIGSQITGTVADVLVAEGERVTAGQRLISLDAHELSAAAIEARGAVAQAESRLVQLRNLTLPAARQALAQAEATRRNAQQNYDRTAALAANGYQSRAALDEAKKNTDIAESQVRTSQLQVFAASPNGSDYLAALTQLSQAQANSVMAQSRLSYAAIVAPRDGLVITRNVERGATVQPGKALLVLAPSGETEIVLQIDERNLAKIAVGQKAVASADAYADQRFEALVSFISPGIDISRASVEVKLAVPQPPEYLRQDMTVSVDIEVARTNDTIVIPARSVHDALSGAPWVLGLRGHRAYRLPIEVGIHGNSQFEVRSGLDEGSMVIPTTANVLPGRRIRPVTR